ncbi:MAG: hypothetical protein K8T25_21725 [Planctomycetia bacterium]|nr:hypothetical protein [Planctomycetia bacterium]
MSNDAVRDIVEMRPAFSWDCPQCGVENFSRAVVCEMSQEEMQELRDDHGVQPWETGHFLVKPVIVTCRSCRTECKTADYANDSESDDQETEAGA